MDSLEIDKLMEKFLDSCSHDLRAPVSSIQGLLKIAEHYPHHREIHKCLKMIEACTFKMESMIFAMEEYRFRLQSQIEASNEEK
jgi:K+-sensing histidine kinase KdpD